MEIHNLTEIITKNIVSCCDQYKDFYTGPHADILIIDAMDFFHKRDYSTEIVNIIVQTASKALCRNFFIYMQSTEGKTQVIREAGGVGCKNVYLQYQHSIFHPIGQVL